MKFLSKNNKGQAVFEFLIFMPFLIILYSIIYNVGNSINGSINQQKATRSFLYGMMRGNSYGFTTSDVIEYQGAGISTMGLYSVAWRQKSENNGQVSYSPCYTFNGLIKSGINDECEKRERDMDMSRHIRVYTAYGICGATFRVSGTSIGMDPTASSSYASCILSK